MTKLARIYNLQAEPKYRWYMTIGIGTLAASMFLVVVYPLQLPVWALFLAVAVAAVFLIPCGTIVRGLWLSLNGKLE